jgi:hypothetical protein
MLNFAGQFKFDARLDDVRQEKPRLVRCEVAAIIFVVTHSETSLYTE